MLTEMERFECAGDTKQGRVVNPMEDRMRIQRDLDK